MLWGSMIFINTDSSERIARVGVTRRESTRGESAGPTHDKNEGTYRSGEGGETPPV